jgi:hypothetical protein
LVDIIIVARAEFQLWIRELSAKNDRNCYILFLVF